MNKMGHLHKILGKLTGMKGMIKQEYPQLTEEKLIQINDELGVCSSNIIKIMMKDD